MKIQNENQTLASITFQNYFRMFPKLSGMTGTALTEAGEFADIYKLEVLEIPTNVNVQRKDHHDEIYRTATERYAAVIELIKECHERGQPVLVGTVSIEKSEYLSGLLKKEKIPHNVLNARHHEREAQIVAQAGKIGAVTIATNMAGRGTDITLGGNPEMMLEEKLEGKEAVDETRRAEMLAELKNKVAEDKQTVLAAGGLYVIGTERHESRRIDNQLRGRSGRQGDPGASKFFLSLQDDLMRIFGSERIDGLLQKMGMKEGEAIFHPWMNKAIEKAQGKVEARNYEIRKNLLKYDDVMNDQRKTIFEQRIELMEEADVSDAVLDMRRDTTEALVSRAMPPRSYAEQWDIDMLERELFRVFNLHVPVKEWAAEENFAEEEMLQRVDAAVDAKMAEKEERYTSEVMRMVEKRVLLQALDELWKDHLLQLDHLRQGIGLRAYGQRDPLNEYKQEAFNLFEFMLNHLREVVTLRLALLEVRVGGGEDLSEMPESHQEMHETRQDPAFAGEAYDTSYNEGERVIHGTFRNNVAPEQRDPQDPATWGKVARNEECPCGSGKKFKNCHGKI